MSRKKMWLGTQHHAQWVDCPLRGADMSPGGWGTEGTYLSGGAFVRQSQDSHRQYIFEWSGASSRESAEIMQALRDGVYSKSRRDLIYFIDPNIYDKNILPKRWAQPGILAPDSGSATTPLGVVSKVDGPGVSGLPLTGAQVSSYFTSVAQFIATTEPQQGSIWVPVPPGKTLHVVAWTGNPVNSESGVYVRGQNLDGTWNPASPVEGSGFTGSGLRGVLIGIVGMFDFYAARAALDLPPSQRPVSYAWTGTPGASVSEKVVGGQVVARNLIHNGSFEYVDSGGDVPLGWQGSYEDIEVFSMSENGFPSDFLFGPYGGVVGDRVASTFGEQATHVYVSNTTPFPVSEGEWAGFGALVTSLYGARVRVQFLDDSNLPVGPLVGTDYETTPALLDGVEIVGAVQAPAGATRARILIFGKETPFLGSAHLYVDAVRVDTAATEEEALHRVRTYFDGDSPDVLLPWSPGLGHSGCAFVGNPTWTATSGVNGGQVGYAATLKEVGDWQQ